MAKRKKKDRFHGLKPHIARLYKAVEHYVIKERGTVAVIGGIQLQHWPNDGDFRYMVAISCIGQKPQFAADRSEK